MFARIEFVQVRIGVLLAHIERGEIVLPAIVVVVPENPDAEVRVVEDEAAEIAHERLHPDAHRDEIVIVRKVAQMNFGERFLQRPEFFFARRSLLRIRVHDIVLFNVDVVVIINAEQPQRPVDRLERGLALEKVDTDRKVVGPKILVAQAEELRAVRAGRAHATRRRQFSRFVLEEIFRGDV